MDPRKAAVNVTYNGKNISSRLADYLSAFSYVDESSGSGDDITITINDRDHKWIGEWMPEKGDIIGAEIQLDNWTKDGDMQKLSCGAFTIDDISFSGYPIRLNLKAIATPANSSFRERERTRIWENITLERMARTISDWYGLGLYYEASSIVIGQIEQKEQDDCKFLYEMVTRYGYAMKIYKSKIVIFDEAIYERRKTVATLNPESIERSWSWKTRLDKTYTGAKYEYTDHDADLIYTVDVGGGDRILKISDSATSLAEARIITLAKINDANKNDTTMSATLTLANPKIIATSCVDITGFKKLDGKYYVTKVGWEISGSGVKQQLTLRKIKDRFTTATALSYRASTD